MEVSAQQRTSWVSLKGCGVEEGLHLTLVTMPADSRWTLIRKPRRSRELSRTMGLKHDLRSEG